MLDVPLAKLQLGIARYSAPGIQNVSLNSGGNGEHLLVQELLELGLTGVGHTPQVAAQLIGLEICTSAAAPLHAIIARCTPLLKV